MAVFTYPAVASPVKSVQRGSAAGAGSVTITAIDISKSFVNIFGTTSSGTVSASFGMSMNAGSMSMVGMPFRGPSPNSNSMRMPSGAGNRGWAYSANTYGGGGSYGAWNFGATVNAGNAVVNAGSNNLVAAVVQGFLANSTTLTVSGACRWEVVEYN